MDSSKNLQPIVDVYRGFAEGRISRRQFQRAKLAKGTLASREQMRVEYFRACSASPEFSTERYGMAPS